ncbi:uncharacterized protein BO72DRAFT_255261 [Aspergillus fijiensis CBS 313.89]|uniref:Uncharacterized protein n=1 Tax=Aspergillus fijiensis CBS 313.89 TaxID=1448319 RepID=A0A8G1RHM1_9EURO|nr:uncharacterized protein BO72DRAFT_255261 [Aspergillus fijiensis CBS 313.89]RAK72868.1 hypothetical protein BO72DRAFT_255261 [Aspergillus fijiensis CBS 313.89]
MVGELNRLRICIPSACHFLSFPDPFLPLAASITSIFNVQHLALSILYGMYSTVSYNTYIPPPRSSKVHCTISIGLIFIFSYPSIPNYASLRTFFVESHLMML